VAKNEFIYKTANIIDKNSTLRLYLANMIR